MLIVSQDGNVRVNYNNVESIEIEERGYQLKSKKEESYDIEINKGYNIYITLVSGKVVFMARYDSYEKAEKAIVAFDEAILQMKKISHFSTSNINEVESIGSLYGDYYIFYFGECEV